jgi:calcineurin-like phosphoesterase family protein
MRAVTRESVRQAFASVLERAGRQPGLEAFVGHWQRGGRTWFWSDQHIGHANIIRFCARPFPDAQAMDNSMQAMACAAGIEPEDWVVFLGDVTFRDDAATREWLASIPGSKLLVLGNHDVFESKTLTRNPLRWGLDAVVDCLEIPVRAGLPAGIERLWLTHYPILSGLPAGVLNLHGHTHDKAGGPEGTHRNLSVEWIGYQPVELDPPGGLPSSQGDGPTIGASTAWREQ